MARIAGVDLPKNKRVEVALTYIYGIGRTRAGEICKKVGFEPSLRVHQLTDDHVASLRTVLEKGYRVEGDVRREVGLSIKRFMDIGCYKGIRHRKGLPVRGQSTRQNARTRKGPKKTVANKKQSVSKT
ncbi:MAG: 30S ribosomal protein S13 [Bdellovibrionales bacterium]|nr:30S ribosomal protein S13 [Bdellovibrionales bacterium]